MIRRKSLAVRCAPTVGLDLDGALTGTLFGCTGLNDLPLCAAAHKLTNVLSGPHEANGVAPRAIFQRASREDGGGKPVGAAWHDAP